MERAAQLLHTPGLSLEGVAKAVGYSSVSQLPPLSGDNMG